ncbi:MAG: recombinase RecT [Candidatus Omnitrophota bacterium]|jgi:recombination protein RecT|nr:MAG: recombinase RecT [Candidatus Omnitrophota bacterium]
MAKQGEVGKALENSPEQKSLTTLIKQSAKELGQALPAHLNPERLVRIALTSIRTNPDLAKCTPESFLGSLFVLAQIGLEPIAGRAYLLPFKNKRKVGNEWVTVPEVQALIGYKGLAELFYRHEAALSIEMQTVHTHDDFAYEYGTSSFIRHKPALGDRGEVIGYYAIAKMKGGGCIFRFMSKAEAMEHGRKHSKTWITQEWDNKEKRMVKLQTPHFAESSPWNKDPDAMCMKTVLIQLAKLLPLSVELQRAIAVDETSREYRKGIDSAMDLPDTTSWEEPPIEVEATAADKNGASPAKQQLPPPEIKSSLPKHIQETIAKTRSKVGDQIYQKILGGLGLTRMEEIPDIATANKLLADLSKEHSARQEG